LAQGRFFAGNSDREKDMAPTRTGRSIDWQASVRMETGAELGLRAKRIVGRAVMLQSENPLERDAHCELLLLPPASGSAKRPVVRASCRIGDSVLSATHFHVWLEMTVLHEGEQWLRA